MVPYPLKFVNRSHLGQFNGIYLMSLQMKQGGTGRVRFQPQIGQLLAVATGSIVNIVDVEKEASLHSLPKVIHMGCLILCSFCNAR